MPPGPWLLGSGLGPLQRLIALALLIAILSHGEAILVPVALAVFLAFVLHPLVRALERLRLPRLAAVGIVLGLALTLVGGLGYVLTTQFREFAAHLPQYSTSIRGKLEALRATRQGAIANIEKTVEEATRDLDRKERATGDAEPPPQRVAVVPAPPSDVARLRAILTPTLEPLLETGVVLVLVAFLLMQREDLRNRVIRLAGPGRVTLTTRTMDEAGQRISRYLLAQSAINAGFGLAIAGGLLWIGVPYALLWGAAAALLRFVPYVGAPLAMVMPATVAAVQFEGWRQAIETVLLFLGIDVLTANLLEPVVIGTRTGVSSLALLLMALFWAWLWGPIGLLLSTPITLCLAVLGKHVPGLEFLAVLLGDDEALEPEITVYQRLLAGDEDEANEIVDRALESTPVDEVFDAVLLPAVVRSASDRAAGHIPEADHEFVLRVVGGIVERISETLPRAEPPGTAPALVMVAGRSATDEIAVDMLARLVDGARFRLERLSTATLASEIVAAASGPDVAAVCIAALPPGGLANARYLCKRLRACHPRLAIVVVRPEASPIDGADRTAGLLDARRYLDDLPAPTPVVVPIPARSPRRSW